jgi:uncharacterized protein
VKKTTFQWDEEKDRENQERHHVSFAEAQRAFLDPHRIIAEDVTHSSEEDRFYCFIRIYGAGYWRKGRKLYEDQNKEIH